MSAVLVSRHGFSEVLSCVEAVEVGCGRSWCISNMLKKDASSGGSGGPFYEARPPLAYLGINTWAIEGREMT